MTDVHTNDPLPESESLNQVLNLAAETAFDLGEVKLGKMLSVAAMAWRSGEIDCPETVSEFIRPLFGKDRNKRVTITLAGCTLNGHSEPVAHVEGVGPVDTATGEVIEPDAEPDPPEPPKARVSTANAVQADLQAKGIEHPVLNPPATEAVPAGGISEVWDGPENLCPKCHAPKGKKHGKPCVGGAVRETPKTEKERARARWFAVWAELGMPQTGDEADDYNRRVLSQIITDRLKPKDPINITTRSNVDATWFDMGAEELPAYAAQLKQHKINPGDEFAFEE